MKRLTIVTLLYLAPQFAFAQACGIYRIEYVGNVTSKTDEIIKVYLPTTMFLHAIEKETSRLAFVDTKLENGSFKIEISSHLTTPYDDIDALLEYYMKQSGKFKMKVSYLVNNSLTKESIEIDWKNIGVTIVEDGEFGTLFRFNLGDISI
jgi:hypothetical protein